MVPFNSNEDHLQKLLVCSDNAQRIHHPVAKKKVWQKPIFCRKKKTKKNIFITKDPEWSKTYVFDKRKKNCF